MPSETKKLSSLAFVLALSVFSNTATATDQASVESFCSGVVPPSSAKEILPEPAGVFRKENTAPINFLADLYAGFSLAQISKESLLKGIGDQNVWHATLFAVHVQQGNLVSAQIVLSLAPVEVRSSEFGRLSRRFLESAYEPFMETSSDTSEDRALNSELTKARSRLISGMASMGAAKQSGFARWHLQAYIYNDPPALLATRRALCANPSYRSIIPMVIQGVAAAK